MIKLIMLAIVMMVVGCRTVATVYEYDKSGKILKRKIITDESAVKSLMIEMSNKNIAWGIYGWKASVRATFVSQETYVPTIELNAANANQWHVSFLKDVDPTNAIRAITAIGPNVTKESISHGTK